MTGLAKRLEERFGLGGMPLARRRLFQRLERISTADQVAYDIIVECANFAIAKGRDKGKCFCSSVTRRLAENGYPATDHVKEVLRQKGRLLQDLADNMRPEVE